MEDAIGGSGVKSLRRGYSWSQEEYGDFLIFEYMYVNESRKSYHDVYLGLYLDFDISSSQGSGYYMDDLVGYDEDLEIGYMWDSSSAHHIGAEILSDVPGEGFNYWNWYHDPENDAEFYERVADLSINSTPPESAYDYRIFLNSGPYSLDPGETLRVVYGIAAGLDRDAFLLAVVQTEELYDSFLVEENASQTFIPTGVVMDVSPNPVKGLTRCTFTLPVQGNFELELVDLAGRLVRRFKSFRENPRDMVLDLSDIAPGMYFLRLSDARISGCTKVVKIK